MVADAKETVGFIGLGLMGHGMAKNIVEKGYPLAVTATATGSRSTISSGAARSPAPSPREVGERSSIVFLCVTGSREVEAIVRGKDGLKEGLKPGSVVVDCSTSDPNSTLALAAELGALGDRLRRRAAVAHAEGGVGGQARHHGRRERRGVRADQAGARYLGRQGGAYRRRRRRPQDEAPQQFHLARLCRDLCRGAALGAKVGISPQRFHSVIDGGRMDCGFYQTFMGSVVGGNREAHRFTLANAFKDLDLSRVDGRRGTADESGRQRGEERLLRGGRDRWRRVDGLCPAPAGVRRPGQRRGLRGGGNEREEGEGKSACSTQGGRG